MHTTLMSGIPQQAFSLKKLDQVFCKSSYYRHDVFCLALGSKDQQMIDYQVCFKAWLFDWLPSSRLTRVIAVTCNISQPVAVALSLFCNGGCEQVIAVAFATGGPLCNSFLQFGGVHCNCILRFAGVIAITCSRSLASLCSSFWVCNSLFWLHFVIFSWQSWLMVSAAFWLLLQLLEIIMIAFCKFAVLHCDRYWHITDFFAVTFLTQQFA